MNIPVTYHPDSLLGRTCPRFCECCQLTSFKSQVLWGLSQLQVHIPECGPYPISDQCRSTQAYTFQPNLGEIRRSFPSSSSPWHWPSCFLFSLPLAHILGPSFLNKHLEWSTLPQNLFPTRSNLHHSPSQILDCIIFYLSLLVVSSIQKYCIC